MERMILLKI